MAVTHQTDMACLWLWLQVAAPPVVELDEQGRGCAVETDLGRVCLGDLCIITWEYDDYGTLSSSHHHDVIMSHP